MMSDLATAAEMVEFDRREETNTAGGAGTGVVTGVVEEILANARSRDRTREIGF